MKNLSLTILLVIICLNSFSQKTDPVGVQTDTAFQKGDKVFSKVEKEAAFPGGAKGWARYLEQNLNADIANKCIRLKKGEQVAEQTVKVQFIVNKEGKISNVATINRSEVHAKLAKEAERAIKEGPDWIPAEQGGRKVIYQALQYITFQVAREQ